MSISFRNRIAFHYMIATAIIMALAFSTIYFVVRETVLANLDENLAFEAQKHTGEIKITSDSILFKNKAEWLEREHREVQVNPVFIQLIDKEGRVMDKSPNLKENLLTFNMSLFGGHFDSQLGTKAIRQVQLPLEQDGKIKGYILAAISSEAAVSILSGLKQVSFLTFLIVLMGLYFISRLIAGRSIKPVQEVTNTITRISKLNLKERVTLPQNKDEIFELSLGFNALLDRIENAIERERQFTSDASHELRTPIASLKGTLEVLIRKPRTQAEYEDKIRFSLAEIEKMTSTLEQLLLLARLDSNSNSHEKGLIQLPTILNESLARFGSKIIDKNLKIEFLFDQSKMLLVPHFYTTIIINNVLSNAIKYAHKASTIKITVEERAGKVVCGIQDQGIGIKKEDLENIYQGFFRSDALAHKHISGNGLGLSIAKKSADAIKANLSVESVLGEGTTVTIQF